MLRSMRVLAVCSLLLIIACADSGTAGDASVPDATVPDGGGGQGGGQGGRGGNGGEGDGGLPGTCPSDVAVQVRSRCFQKGTAGIGNLPETGTTYEDVVAYCDDLELGGYTNWALPDINELRGLIDGCVNDCPVSDPVCLNPLDCSPASCADCGEDFQGPGEDGCFLDPAFTGGCQRALCSSSTFANNDFEVVWEILPRRGDIDSQLLRDERRVGCDARCILR